MPSDMISGILLSVASWSEENRLRIRPIGVWSKNINGARIIAHRTVLCNITEAFSVPKRGARSHAIDEKASNAKEERERERMKCLLVEKLLSARQKVKNLIGGMISAGQAFREGKGGNSFLQPLTKIAISWFVIKTFYKFLQKHLWPSSNNSSVKNLLMFNLSQAVAWKRS